MSYNRGVTLFQDFRLQTGLQTCWPALYNQVVAFIAHLSLQGLASSTINSYTSAISLVHNLHNWPNPTNNFLVQKIREGCGRQPHQSDTRRPITAGLLQKICTILGHITSSDFERSLFSSAFLLAFYGFLRVGEFTVSSKHSDSSRTLGRNDVWFESSDPLPMIVRLRFSKTDQRGDSAILRFHSMLHPSFCPVNALAGYLHIHCTAHFRGSPIHPFRRNPSNCLSVPSHPQ